MYVINVSGMEVKVKYRDTVITIPYDNKFYSVPDDMKVFPDYLKEVRPYDVRFKDVPYIRTDGKVSDIETHKRRGRPEKPERDPNDKPLKGVRAKIGRDGKKKKAPGRPKGSKTLTEEEKEARRIKKEEAKKTKKSVSSPKKSKKPARKKTTSTKKPKKTKKDSKKKDTKKEE